MRVILYTGKGGVGKTTVAAATAVRCAELGYKTLVMSTDAAHSLSDSLDMPLEGRGQPLLAPNLWGQEMDINRTIADHWGEIQKYISALLAWKGMDKVMAEEMAIFPGMEELANLLYIAHYEDDAKYDVVIVDCAPTGETLRLLSFPEILHWWMDKLFPIERKLMSLVRPLAKRVVSMPLPENKVLDDAELLYSEIERIHALLTDTTKSSIRLVVNPEKMVIKETQRTFAYLNLYSYSTDLIVCNRLIPKSAGNGYFSAWLESQTSYLQMIEECFSPVPLRKLHLQEREVVGIPMLKGLAEALFGNEDPAAIFFQGQSQEVRCEGGHYILSLDLPSLEKGQVSLMRSGSELIVQLNNFKRNIILPVVLRQLEVGRASFEQGRLEIKFESKK